MANQDPLTIEWELIPFRFYSVLGVVWFIRVTLDAEDVPRSSLLEDGFNHDNTD